MQLRTLSLALGPKLNLGLPSAAAKPSNILRYFCGPTPSQQLSLMTPNSVSKADSFADQAAAFQLLPRPLSSQEIPVPLVAADRVIPGTRGGCMLRSSEGLIQFGAPAGVMDDMFGHFLEVRGFDLPVNERRHALPMIVVADEDLPEPTTGFFATEFTQYSPFIVFPEFVTEHRPDQRMRYITANQASAQRLRDYLRLSFEGPRDDELPEPMQTMVNKSYPPDYPRKAIPKIRDELKYFQTVSAGDLAAVSSFDENGVIDVGRVTIMRDGPLHYLVWDDGQFLGRVDLTRYQVPPRVLHANFDHSQDFKFQKDLKRVLDDRLPGIMPISTANGFTGGGGESTSGYLDWHDGRAIIVDPPLNTLQFLITNSIPLSAIEGIHITHGHGDHFTVATAELLAAFPDLPVYAAPVEMAMIQLQYAQALGSAGLPTAWWRAVTLGLEQFVNVGGRVWRLTDGFHAVPATGLVSWNKPDLQNGQPMIVFSGDTAMSSAVMQGTIPSRVMTQQRRRAVMQPLTHVTTPYPKVPHVLVEGGAKKEVPNDPHTALSFLSEWIRVLKARGVDTSRTRVYHNKVAEVDQALPGHVWSANAAGFLDLSEFVEPAQANVSFGAARPNILSSQAAKSFSVSDEAARLLDIGVRESLSDGDVLITKGDANRDLYVILSGSMRVTTRGNKPILLTAGDVLGEMAYIQNGRRTATVTAQSFSPGATVEVLRIPAIALDVLVGQYPEILQHLKALAQERKSGVA